MTVSAMGTKTSDIENDANLHNLAARIQRLGEELGAVLDLYCDGRFRAVVEPAARSNGSTLLERISRDASCSGWAAGSLEEAVANYRAGLDDYNINAPDPLPESLKYVEQSYGPPMDVLLDWKAPAQNAGDALAALKIAKWEITEGSPALVLAMITAAIGYFERGPL